MLARVNEWLEGFARGAWTRLAFFSLLALCSVWPLLAQAGALNEFRDAHVLLAYERSARTSLLGFGQLPLWDPYYCGGLYLLGTPQSRFAAPPFLFTLLLGPLRAQPVIAFVMLMLGMEGAYRYFRERARTALPAMLAAPMIALSGIFAVSYFFGWINFYGFELVPWVLYGVRRASLGDVRGVPITALAFAFIIGFGGTYAAPMAALFAPLEVFRTALEQRFRIRHALPVIAAAALAALGMSAFRLWPIWETLSSSPRLMAGTPSHSWQALANMLFEPAVAVRGDHGYNGLFYARAFGFGFGALALFVPRAWPAFAIGGLSVWAATGYLGSTSPFVWLRELPIYSTLRYPERFLFFTALFGAELAAIGAALLLRVRFRILKLLFSLTAIGVFVAGAVALVQNQIGAVQGMALAPPPLEHAGEFRQARGNRWLLGYYQPLSRGSLSCWEAYPVAQSAALRGDLPAEEYLADPEAGTATRAAWSPNRIDVNTALTRPTRLIVNQNWHPGWRASTGSVVSHEGLLAVELPAGEHHVRLRFLPRSAIGGIAISIATLLAMFGFVAYRRGRWGRKQVRTWLCMGSPVLALALAFAIPEPPHLPVRYTNANGLPAVVDALPAEAKPLEVRFELPVELVGAIVHPSVDGQTDIELFWRVSGAVPRSVGVFVHFTAGQRFETADHLAVSASFYFADAPRDRIIRDAFSVRLPPRPPATWQVSAGLWHAGADGARVEVREPGRAEIHEHAISLGEVDVRP